MNKLCLLDSFYIEMNISSLINSESNMIFHNKKIVG